MIAYNDFFTSDLLNLLSIENDRQMEVLKTFDNGFSLGLHFSKDEVNFLNQVAFTKNSNYGFVILDLDMNLNLIGAKNLSFNGEFDKINFSVYSNKHAITLETLDNICCINGNTYSGKLLLIY